MAESESVDMKNVVQHLVNGSLSELCLICLNPLNEESFESIFTLICKNNTEYCVADALEAVCQFEPFLDSDNHNVCSDCFKSASTAYKFRQQAKRSMEIISYYTTELIANIENIEICNEDMDKVLYIPLSEYCPETCLLDLNLDVIGKVEHVEEAMTISNDHIEHTESTNEVPEEDSQEENVIVVVEENKKTSYFNVTSEGTLNPLESESDDEDMVMIINEKKERKKRDPMVYLQCTRCSIKYRFISKLKSHMKTVHNIDIYYCKLCKLTTENKEQYDEHLEKHIGKYQCSICNAVYKKSETLVAHMDSHKLVTKEQREPLSMVAGECNKVACFYCGRMYKGRASLDTHIQKHEDYWNKRRKGEQPPSAEIPRDRSKRCVCQICGKDFVDERALLWHQRLHNNDRPFPCEQCGRTFVTKNRRNQHALCAHTAPTRRCPLCPALFHLRSMVNSHVKRVHLKKHKRRNRASKYENVCWKTEPVPIEELSVDVQSDVLDIQTSLHQMAKEPIVPSLYA